MLNFITFAFMRDKIIYFIYLYIYETLREFITLTGVFIRENVLIQKY